MYVIDLEGGEYPAQITYTWEAEINGKPIVTAEIEATKVNLLYLHDLTEMWTLVLEDIEYKIKYLKRQGKGDKLRATVKAVPLFFDRFKALRIYDRYDRHMTAQFYFSLLFEGTEYNFVLNGTFEAQQWEGAGDGETRLKMFENGLNRYKGEFRIVGNTIYIENLIGIDSQARYEHMLNASNIIQEIDADEMYTYARGYGDYGDGEGGEDWQDHKLFREYTSPLSRIPGIGIIDAPPIKNGNITTAEKMDEQLRILVNESLKISVTATIHDLREQGYPIAQSGLGDRVFLIDRRIGFDEEIRVVSKMVKKRWDGKVIDASYTFGTPGLVKRHQSNMNAAVRNITDLLNGKLKLPFSVLDNAVAEATKALHKMQSELSIPANGGLLAVDKNNPNNVVVFNAAGLGVSNDGGATFRNSITGQGVIAETIIGNSIIGLNLTSVDESGYFHVNGSNAEFLDTNTNRRVTLNPTGLYGYNAGGSVRFQADSSLVTSAALATSNLNVYLASEDTNSLGEVRAVKYSTLGGTGSASDYQYVNVRTRAIKSPPGANAYVGTDGEFRIMSEGLISNGVYRWARATGYYGNTLEVNGGSILYLRSDNRVRVMGTGASSSFSDLQAQRYLLPDGSNAFSRGSFSELSLPPNKDEGIDLINSMNLLRYTENGKPVYKMDGKDLAIDSVVANLVKSNQETIDKLNYLERMINDE